MLGCSAVADTDTCMQIIVITARSLIGTCLDIHTHTCGAGAGDGAEAGHVLRKRSGGGGGGGGEGEAHENWARPLVMPRRLLTYWNISLRGTLACSRNQDARQISQ